MPGRQLRVLAACECSGRVRDAFAARGWESWSADLLPSETPVCAEVFPGNRYSGASSPVDAGGYSPGCHYQGDVRDLFSWDHPVNQERAQTWALPHDRPLWDLVIAFPPCTHLSQAGAVWWKHKDATRGGDGRMQEGAAFFREMTQAPAPHVAVENPVGVTGLPNQACYYRRPDQVVEPYMFGDPLRKRTCLWLKGLPPLAADNLVTPAPGGRVATGGGSWRTDQRNGRGANNGHEDSEGRSRRQVVRNRTLPGLARAMADQWGSYLEGLYA